MLKKFFLFLPLLFLGCFQEVHKSECNPSFFTNYTHKKGEIVGIGIAAPNLNGFTAQKRSAISKAINQIAMQLGVTVKSVSLMQRESVNHQKALSSFSQYSLQTVNGKKVRAKIVKECKSGDYYYVLMKAY